MQQDEQNFNKNFIRIALLGSTKSGKSTLLGVLTKGIKDDGINYARNLVQNYGHEIEKGGQTESIIYEILGFDNNGRQVFSTFPLDKKGQYQADIFRKSNSYIYMMDTCGDERYFKQSLSFINKCFINLSIIVISAIEGLTKISQECIIICQQYNIPFIIILTKIDLVQSIQEKQKIINSIHNILSSTFQQRKLTKPIDPQKCANEMVNKFLKHKICKSMICPLFEINNLTREGIDNLLTFLYNFKNTDSIFQELGSIESEFQFIIFYICQIKKKGDIPYGIITHGSVKLDQIVSIGLDENKQNICCKVTSIQNVRNDVKIAYAGQMVCIGLQPLIQQNIDYQKIKIITDPKINIPLVKQFNANIVIFPGPTTIGVGYKPILELLNIQKQVNFKQIFGEQQTLRAGNSAIVLLEFLDNEEEPVFENYQFLLRCATTVAYGHVINTNQQLINDIV